MKLLIDGDILVYRAGFAVQSGAVGEGDDIEYPPTSHALQAVKMMLNNIHQKCRYDQSWIFLSSNDKSNYRYEVAVTKPYKGNRTAGRPVYFDAIREYLVDKHGAVIVYGQEADDALGIASNTTDTVLVTIDKDLDMIPGWHFNFVKDLKYYVNRTEAYRNFCVQMLVGDSVDNIVGVKGIGPVKAAKAIAEAKRDKARMLQIVYDLYDDEDLFLEMGKLLWIRRNEDEIWEPNLQNLRKHK